MLTIFNRAQLILTTDTGRQAKIREALAGAGIDCAVRASARGARGRGVSSLGAAPPSVWEYRIDVRRKDLDWARNILAGL